MPIPSIFPSYMQGENRVTVAILAVLERISVQLVERIFRVALEDDSFSIVRFISQPPLEGTKKRPDGEIVASCRYLFEVKRVSGALEEQQLREYLGRLSKTANERLIALTPDIARPAIIDAINDPRLVWVNFISLSDAIEQLVEEDGERIAEQDRFLLRELQAHFEEGGLLRLGQDVAVVAASGAYPLYLKHHVYACQPEHVTTFRPEIIRLGFYADGAIQREVPLILKREGEFELTKENLERFAASDEQHDRAMAAAMRGMMQDVPGWYPEGGTSQVFLLEPPNAPGTQLLDQPVVNTTKAASGRPFAYVLGKRYTRIVALAKQPKTTDELAEYEQET
jgi:hypothetical protein